ncbi:MAG TPA: YoaK family protein [Polyangiaceae bacterium]
MPPAQAAEARRSRPSLTPASRPSYSLIPNPSIMPGMGMHLHSVLLSGVAGYVDAAGFASLIGLFPAHITGEIVGEALALSSGHASDHLARLWVLPVFVVSVVMATLVARMRRRNGQRALTGLLALVTGALALFTVSDVLTRVLHAGPHLSFLLGGGCAVAAMGFQNSLMRESLASSCPTTVMTGNLTHIVIEIADHFLSKVLRPSKRDRKPRSNFAPIATALVAFIACAVLGGFLTRLVGSSSAVLPTALTLVLTIRAWREDRRRTIANTLVASIAPAAPLPSFDVWPESLAPRTAALYSASETQTKAGTPAAIAAEPERPPMKRTISGTQLSQRFRDGK